MERSPSPPYKDATITVSERVRDLLSRMTLEEKASQTATFSIGGMGGLLNRIPPQEARDL